MKDVYHRLAEHLQDLVMGYPYNQGLIELLREMFTPAEAEAVLALPTNLAPLETADLDAVAARSSLPRDELDRTLRALDEKRMIFAADLDSERRGYAPHQVGYGMPQAFFWHGRNDEQARRMARLVLGYFSVPTTREVYGGTKTKTFKYLPVGVSVQAPTQGALPHEHIAPVLENAEKIALAHCPCRMSARILGRTDCAHSLEVCFKYDDMAEYVVSRGLARQVSQDEALHVMGRAEKEGLVHMLDNVRARPKHTCNCCGHYCWNVGIVRRRKIPRDDLMASYFIRETEEAACIGCGACADICPVDAVDASGDTAAVDLDWCIGCGVCAGACPAEAISIARRIDDTGPADHMDLTDRIRRERGLLGP